MPLSSCSPVGYRRRPANSESNVSDVPDRAEIESSLYGAWRLARLDPGGLRYLNLTIEGFWRSFFVIVPLLPAQLLVAWLVADPEALATQGASGWLLIRAGLTLFTWLLFLGSMAPLSRMLGLSDHYPTYVIAWNWASAVQMALLLPVGLLFGLDLLSQQLGGVLMLAVWLAIVAYDYAVARLALGADRFTAAGVVIYSVVLELVIESAAEVVLPL